MTVRAPVPRPIPSSEAEQRRKKSDRQTAAQLGPTDRADARLGKPARGLHGRVGETDEPAGMINYRFSERAESMIIVSRWRTRTRPHQVDERFVR